MKPQIIYFTDDEKEQIKKEAERVSLSLSSFVRFTLKEKLNKTDRQQNEARTE